MNWARAEKTKIILTLRGTPTQRAALDQGVAAAHAFSLNDWALMTLLREAQSAFRVVQRKQVARVTAVTRICRVCGCFELQACDVQGFPCGWTDLDTCTRCAPLWATLESESGREWLESFLRHLIGRAAACGGNGSGGEAYGVGRSHEACGTGRACGGG